MVDNAAADLGRRGGKARAARMTKEERSEAARQAVTARWDRVRAEAKARKKAKKRDLYYT
jgi:hypothetical protein